MLKENRRICFLEDYKEGKYEEENFIPYGDYGGYILLKYAS